LLRVHFVSLHLQIQQAAQAQLKGLTIGELEQRVLSSAPGKERPQPYTHVLDFHARQAIKHATAQGWNAVKSLPMTQSEEAVTPGWVNRIARWKQSLGTQSLLHTIAADLLSRPAGSSDISETASLASSNAES
jgi:hypothetical protein